MEVTESDFLLTLSTLGFPPISMPAAFGVLCRFEAEVRSCRSINIPARLSDDGPGLSQKARCDRLVK